jgi:hypothetical protein
VTLGPVTRMNMERRQSEKHQLAQSQPWDSVTIRMVIESQLKVQEFGDRIHDIKLPSGWFYGSTEPYLNGKFVVAFVVNGPITFADGAQVRAILNLIK